MNNLATTLLKKLNPANTPEKITVSELGDIYIRQVSIGEQSSKYQNYLRASTLNLMNTILPVLP